MKQFKPLFALLVSMFFVTTNAFSEEDVRLPVVAGDTICECDLVGGYNYKPKGVVPTSIPGYYKIYLGYILVINMDPAASWNECYSFGGVGGCAMLAGDSLWVTPEGEAWINSLVDRVPSKAPNDTAVKAVECGNDVLVAMIILDENQQTKPNTHYGGQVINNYTYNTYNNTYNTYNEPYQGMRDYVGSNVNFNFDFFVGQPNLWMNQMAYWDYFGMPIPRRFWALRPALPFMQQTPWFQNQCPQVCSNNTTIINEGDNITIINEGGDTPDDNPEGFPTGNDLPDDEGFNTGNDVVDGGSDGDEGFSGGNRLAAPNETKEAVQDSRTSLHESSYVVPSDDIERATAQTGQSDDVVRTNTSKGDRNNVIAERGNVDREMTENAVNNLRNEMRSETRHANTSRNVANDDLRGYSTVDDSNRRQTESRNAATRSNTSRDSHDYSTTSRSGVEENRNGADRTRTANTNTTRGNSTRNQATSRNHDYANRNNSRNNTVRSNNQNVDYARANTSRERSNATTSRSSTRSHQSNTRSNSSVSRNVNTGSSSRSSSARNQSTRYSSQERSNGSGNLNRSNHTRSSRPSASSNRSRSNNSRASQSRTQRTRSQAQRSSRRSRSAQSASRSSRGSGNRSTAHTSRGGSSRASASRGSRGSRSSASRGGGSRSRGGR